VFDSERPTSQAPYRAALAAQLAAEQRKREQEEKAKEQAKPEPQPAPAFEESEAPTGVEVERPLFPKPPRMPRV
jgi:hypothetical protein